MEDHSGRVSLDGAIKTAIHHLVTGVVVAVKGKLNEDGILIVSCRSERCLLHLNRGNLLPSLCSDL
jgi:hypothetical protein